MAVTLLRTGTTPMPPAYAHRDEGGWRHALGLGVSRARMIPAPIGAALVTHPVRGPLLVDTGLHPVCATDPARNLGRVGAAILRVAMEAGEDAPSQLRARGIDPASIELVFMTHLHADHTSAMSEFPRARFVIDAAEWRAARGRLAARNGYATAHLPPRDRVELVDFAAAEPHATLARTLDYFGDGSLRLVSTPGHTVGHMSVLAQGSSGSVFLLGDPVYTLRNLRDDVLPWRTADDGRSRATVRELRDFAARHPDVPLIPTHDPAVWDELAGRDL